MKIVNCSENIIFLYLILISYLIFVAQVCLNYCIAYALGDILEFKFLNKIYVL